jgi:zinc transport system substrate-binding protein
VLIGCLTFKFIYKSIKIFSNIHARAFWLALFVFACQGIFLNMAFADLPYVLVSVAPHKFFVEKIAKNTVQVQLIVPAGASAHTYEPTPRQIVTAGKAGIWFCIGEPFENRAMQAIKSHAPDLKIVNLQQGLDLISTEHTHNTHCSCCPGSIDLHFWLSARQAKIQAKTIADALGKVYPAYANFYQTNLEGFEKELAELDETIKSLLAVMKNRYALVSHPAYAYFCRDYDIEQYAIEVEGKDPTPQQMTKLLNLAREKNVQAIFIQMQYNNKAAKLVAETLGARLIVLDPYSEQYLSSMLEIAQAFARE